MNLKVFQHGGRKQHKYEFVFSRSLLLNRLEPQSSKAKLLLPMMPIGIVEYAFTLLWDNLCRNSCMCVQLKLSNLAANFHSVLSLVQRSSDFAITGLFTPSFSSKRTTFIVDTSN